MKKNAWLVCAMAGGFAPAQLLAICNTEELAEKTKHSFEEADVGWDDIWIEEPVPYIENEDEMKECVGEWWCYEEEM